MPSRACLCDCSTFHVRFSLSNRFNCFNEALPVCESDGTSIGSKMLARERERGRGVHRPDALVRSREPACPPHAASRLMTPRKTRISTGL